MTRAGIVVLATLWLLSGCANLVPTQPPKVSLVYLKRLPPEGLDQRFLLGLRLSNPNKKALPLRSLHYKVSLNGRELVTGMSGPLPTIAAQGDTLVELDARMNLINAVLRLGEILRGSDAGLTYQLDTDLELIGLPDVHLSKTGPINLE